MNPSAESWSAVASTHSLMPEYLVNDNHDRRPVGALRVPDPTLESASPFYPAAPSAGGPDGNPPTRMPSESFHYESAFD